MKKVETSKLSVFIILIMIVQLFSPLSSLVKAEYQEGDEFRENAFVVDIGYSNYFESEYIHLIRDNFTQAFLIVNEMGNPPTSEELEALKGERVYYRGYYSTDKGSEEIFQKHTVMDLRYIRTANPDTDSNLNEFSLKGEFIERTKVINSIIEEWIVEDETGQVHKVYIYSSVTNKNDIKDLKGIKTDVQGYEIKSTNNKLITNIVLPEDYFEDPSVKYLTVTLDNLHDRSYGYLRYEAVNPDSTSEVDWAVEFFKDYIGDKFPVSKLEDRTISIKAVEVEKYKNVEGEELLDKIHYQVLDWEFVSESDTYTSTVGVPVSVKSETQEHVTYQFDSFYGDIIRITFSKDLLGEYYPEESLIGKQLNIIGFEQDQSRFLEVSQWSEIEVGEPDNITLKERKIYHGTLKELTFTKEYDNSSRVKERTFILEDFEGNKHVVIFDDENLSSMPDEEDVGRKIKLDATEENVDSNNPFLYAYDFDFQRSDYHYGGDEIVALVGTITYKYDSAKHNRSVYQFDSGGKTYIAVFDKEVLGDAYTSTDLTGKEIELTGYTELDNNVLYMAVMGWRYTDNLSDYGDGMEYEYEGETFNFQVLNGTIVDVIAETEDDIIYRILSEENGAGHFVVFTKELLGEHFPTYSLIGENVRLETIYNDEEVTYDTPFFVISWATTEYRKMDKDRGVFLELLETSDSSYVYLFKSINNREYKVQINTETIVKMGVEPEDILESSFWIYGYEKSWYNQRIFDMYAIYGVEDSFNEQTSPDVVIQGTLLLKLEGENPYDKPIYYLQNQYGENTLITFERKYLEGNYPLEDLIGKEIVIKGYLNSQDIVTVKEWQIIEIPEEYPVDREDYYQDPLNFPNLKGYKGMLSVLYTDKPYLVLITAYDTYLLSGDKEVMREVEDNLGKLVYLRGEQSEISIPYWTGQMKVYDIKPLDTEEYNIIIQPKSKPLPDLVPDPQKDAVDTIQLPTETPKDYLYGEGIIEAKFFPEYIPVKDGFK